MVGVILHACAHLACDLPRISDLDRLILWQTIAARFGYHQSSYFEILATWIIMVVVMIAFSLATKIWLSHQPPSLPRSVRNVTGYIIFWYSHHLFIAVYALLILNSVFLFLTDNVTKKTVSL